MLGQLAYVSEVDLRKYLVGDLRNLRKLRKLLVDILSLAERVASVVYSVHLSQEITRRTEIILVAAYTSVEWFTLGYDSLAKITLWASQRITHAYMSVTRFSFKAAFTQ